MNKIFISGNNSSTLSTLKGVIERDLPDVITETIPVLNELSLIRDNSILIIDLSDPTNHVIDEFIDILDGFKETSTLNHLSILVIFRGEKVEHRINDLLNLEIEDCIFTPYSDLELIFRVKRVIDIHKKKIEYISASVKLEDQSRILDLIFKNSLDSIVLLDKDYNFIRVSDTYAKSCNRPSSDFPGQNHFDMYPSVLIHDFNRIKRDKTIYQATDRPFEFPDHPEWGITYWNLGLVPILDNSGEIEMFLFTLKDVTTLHREEEMKNKLYTAITQIDQSIIITDKEGVIEYVNPAFELTSGYNSDEVIGKTPNILKSGEHTDEFYSELWNRLVDGERWKGRLVNKNRSGELYTEDVIISPVYNSINELSNYVAVKKDITYELKLQEKINHIERMESIGKLAGGIAHDFNNVLNGVISSTQLLKLQMNDRSDVTKKYVDIIEKASIRASNLVNKLLLYTKKDNKQFKTFFLEDVIYDVRDILISTIDKKIDVLVNVSDPHMDIYGDISSLEFVFLNLGINASHAISNSGEITFNIRKVYLNNEFCNNSNFDIKPGDYMEITVHDTGCGIPRESLKRVFEPFFTTKSLNGTGLGLSTSLSTIIEHMGTITVESIENKETTFYIHLPISKKVVDPKQVKKETSTGRGTILFIDDEEINRILGEDILKSFGFEVILAADGREALKIYKDRVKQIDLVITDMVMPGMGGSEILGQLRLINPLCKVIISSGYSNNSFIEEDDITGFLKKPYGISNLKSILNKILV